jgi:hypothetical protein
MDAEQVTAEDPQLAEIGQRPVTATFLQAGQDLGLDQRGQAPQHDLVPAGDRGAGPAPAIKVRDRGSSGAMLLPPAHIMRPAQPPPRMSLTDADYDPARAEAGQRPRPGMGEELCQRKRELLAAMLAGVTQLQASRADRTRASAHRADDLPAPPGPDRPGSDELLDTPVASLAGPVAGGAKRIRQKPLSLAAADEADPEAQQRMIRRGREGLGLRFHPAPARKTGSR